MSLTPADTVRALSLACFGSAPEPAQLDAMLVEIGEDPAALDAVARRMCAYRQKLDQIRFRNLPDHSENGEFRMLLRELVTAARAPGIVVDVGANGRAGSNAYDLLTDYGWTGLLIEANPQLLPRIRAEFGGASYDLVDCAIGVVAGRQTLHLGDGDQISSLRIENVARWGAITGAVDVAVRRLSDVLDEHAIPHDFDILSLDIEGVDADVLNDLVATSPYRPRWIVIETALPLDAPLVGSALSEEVQRQYALADRTLANLVLRRVQASA